MRLEEREYDEAELRRAVEPVPENDRWGEQSVGEDEADAGTEGTDDGDRE